LSYYDIVHVEAQARGQYANDVGWLHKQIMIAAEERDDDDEDEDGEEEEEEPQRQDAGAAGRRRTPRPALGKKGNLVWGKNQDVHNKNVHPVGNPKVFASDTWKDVIGEPTQPCPAFAELIDGLPRNQNGQGRILKQGCMKDVVEFAIECGAFHSPAGMSNEEMREEVYAQKTGQPVHHLYQQLHGTVNKYLKRKPASASGVTITLGAGANFAGNIGGGGNTVTVGNLGGTKSHGR
jgi:hypothetical protein